VNTEQHREVGLAGRYATAVFELAQEARSVDALEKDFASLRGMIANSADLARLVRSPVFGHEEQGKAMKAVLEAMGTSTLATQFVLTLAAKRRLFALVDIIDAFGRLLANQRGEVQAEVTSARALSDAETADLKAVLKAKLGREPRLETKVDPTLLGGLVVKVGSRMIDSSLRTKLTGIRAAMRGN
jgi:F-type H+-transporting ATPase subunit delta